MKIPFHTILRPVLVGNGQFIHGFCKEPFMGFTEIYVPFMGILGMILSFFDLIVVVKRGRKERVFWTQGSDGLSPEVQRDLRLVALWSSVQQYFCLILGAATENPIFFLPFLFWNIPLIIMDFITLFLVMFNCGINALCKDHLIASMFTIYNWLNVFCVFCNLLTGCDF